MDKSKLAQDLARATVEVNAGSRLLLDKKPEAVASDAGLMDLSNKMVEYIEEMRSSAATRGDSIGKAYTVLAQTVREVADYHAKKMAQDQKALDTIWSALEVAQKGVDEIMAQYKPHVVKVEKTDDTVAEN